MAKSADKTTIDTSTEEKIKEAARKVFTRKGYLATKVRDIATEADINLSLVNYYFRSKEKLFELIMQETVYKLFAKIEPVINDEQTTVTEKTEIIAGHYIDLLLQNPDFPLFIINEVISGLNKFSSLNNYGKILLESHFARQLRELEASGKISFHPLHVLLNIIGLIVFPFLSRPLILQTGAITPEEFRQIMEGRKKLIPLWISQILNL